MREPGSTSGAHRRPRSWMFRARLHVDLLRVSSAVCPD
ncbi:MAG TPA: putative leader peptide [Mycobacteriales bacterium]